MNENAYLLPNRNSNFDIGLIHHVFRQKSLAPWRCVKFTKMKAPMYKFIYVLEGKYYATINKKEFVIGKNEALLLKKGENYFSKSITLPFDYIEIEFIIYARTIDGEFKDFYHLQHPELIENIMLELHKLWCGNDPAKFCKLKSLAYQLFVCLINENENQNEKYLFHKIKNSVNYIEDNCMKKNIEVQELADLCDLSLSQFNRIFKAVFNQTPKKYINFKRIDRAGELLAGTNYPVSSIAELCGFSDNYYFCKIFKKYTGLSPLKYRSQFFR